MKNDIHPTYYTDAKITCACGHVFSIGSTKEKLDVEICSNCHPFYTGKKDKLIDTQGRVERYKRMVKQAEKISEAKAKKTAEKAEKKVKAKKTPAKAKKNDKPAKKDKK